jgi:hypothetical protein
MLALENRLQLYVRFVTAFLLGSTGMPMLISLMTGSNEVGLVLGTFVIFVLTHLLLAFWLIDGSKLKKSLFGVGVLVVSFALMTFKIWVNESVIDHHLNFWGPSKLERNLNYICYFVWTTIFIWEIVSCINQANEEKLKGVKQSR